MREHVAVLTELRVEGLGVIDAITLLLGPGMTALTGETGAGKTLLVEAIELLVGGRADPALVRPGHGEARVEGRFVVDDDEVVLARVVPAEGRSRAYLDGRLAPVAALAERGAALIDLHGQHAHQSLLSTAMQRAALDRFGAVDLEALRLARAELTSIDAELATLGGDERARAREIDLLRFQVDEIDRAGVTGPDEDERLVAEEALLADAAGHREAAAAAAAALADEGGAIDDVGAAIAGVAGRTRFRDVESRLRAVSAELADLATEARTAAEHIEDDPERLAAVQARRQLLTELRRKYGESLADVLTFGDDARARLDELASHEERAGALGSRRRYAERRLADAAAAVARQRREAAPGLAAAVQGRLGSLALAKARIEVAVAGDDPGDEVSFLLAANKGSPLLPLSKVASGGELARAMLALRLVLSGVSEPARASGPSTLVFDEVDAGVGGEAAVAVGEALAALARHRQVLVVTHLPQVAALADRQIAVTKSDKGRTTMAHAAILEPDERVVELARMLSGSPDSTSARSHAADLLRTAGERRVRGAGGPSR